MPYKDPNKRKEYSTNNKEKKKEQNAKYYEKNKEKEQECAAKRLEDRKQHAYDSITSGEIIDQHKWNVWCNRIKCSARRNKHPYSADFTNDIMFDMMRKGCFYCENIATTLDRVDSKLNHTLDNCVGCCHGCNMSKGVADSATFIKKAYYRARGKYYDDDTNIWFVNKQKPRLYMYKTNANKQGVQFDLTVKEFEVLIEGNCEYCKRSPITWFGIDRVVPSLGYTTDNIVSCCFDCNVDKLEGDVDTMMKRNCKIANRVDTSELAIDECEKKILNR